MSHLPNSLPPHLQPSAMPNSVPKVPPHLVSAKNKVSQVSQPKTTFDEEKIRILALRFKAFLDDVNSVKNVSNGHKPNKATIDRTKRGIKEAPIKKKIVKKKVTPKSKGQANTPKVIRERELPEQNYSQAMEELFTEIRKLTRKGY